MRLSSYDEDGWLLAFHYATPWPVLAGWAWVLASGWWQVGSKQPWAKAICAVCVAVGMGCVCAWFKQSFAWGKPGSWANQAAPGTHRLIVWNVGGPQGDAVERAAAYLHAQGADLIALNERGDGWPGSMGRWARAFPDRTVTLLPNEKVLIVAGTVAGTPRLHNLAGLGSCHECRVRWRDSTAELLVLLVDFAADLTRSRAPAFAALQALVATRTSEPKVVLGDFNTPGDSPHYGLLKAAGLRDAFAVAGRGFSETWPVPVPLLSLDHMFFSGAIQVRQSRLGWSTASDHRPVIADLVDAAED